MPPDHHLTKDDLDPAFPDNPVMAMHVSLHRAVLNSAAMAKYGFSEQTETPAGGVIVRRPGTNEPLGLVMETAFLPIFAALPTPTPEQELEQLRAGQMIYAAAGVTTAQEGATHAAQLAVLQRGAEAGAGLRPRLLDPQPPAARARQRRLGVKVIRPGLECADAHHLTS
jgi:predicted amidohydrolase YtcJ